MIHTNSLQERETISPEERTTHSLTELLKIAENEFRRHAAAREFGREIQDAILDDEGRSRRWKLWKKSAAQLVIQGGKDLHQGSP